MNILFVYYHKYPQLWRDGLYKAMSMAKHKITWLNLANSEYKDDDYDCIVGWGAFGSPADLFMQEIPHQRKYLLLAGNATPVPTYANFYTGIGYETDWIKNNYLKDVKTRLVKAFGINTDIYKFTPMKKIFKYISVGSFSLWKNHNKIIKHKRFSFGDEGSYSLCVGEIQRDNMNESMGIIRELLDAGVVVSDMVEPEKLNLLYNVSETAVIGADINGGGERAVLEARACVLNVEVYNDKLRELLSGPIYNQNDYLKGLEELWSK